jgi:hypothetical protein
MNPLTGRRASAVALAMLFVTAFPAAADGDSLFTLQRDWWQWAGSIPIEVSPLVDETGKYCDAGQRGRYWFLAGNFGGRTTRSCTVPKGTILVAPVIVTFCYPEEGFDTDESCIGYVNDVLAGYRPENLTVTVDGVPQATRDVCEIAAAPGDALPPIAPSCVVRRRANRTLWNFTIGSAGFYLSEPGVWRANAARGVWSLIDTSQLSTGKHTIVIHAKGKAGAVIPLLNVTYNLTVARARN